MPENKPKQVKTFTLRRLPPEWHKFRIICISEGTTATDKIREFIIETVDAPVANPEAIIEKCREMARANTDNTADFNSFLIGCFETEIKNILGRQK